MQVMFYTLLTIRQQSIVHQLILVSHDSDNYYGDYLVSVFSFQLGLLLLKVTIIFYYFVFVLEFVALYSDKLLKLVLALVIVAVFVMIVVTVLVIIAIVICCKNKNEPGLLRV